MSVDSFIENREFFDDNRKESVEDFFKKLLDQHGPEVAKGYLMCIEDIKPKISDIYHSTLDGKKFYRPTQQEMRVKATELFSHVDELSQLKNLIDSKDINFDKTKLQKLDND